MKHKFLTFLSVFVALLGISLFVNSNKVSAISTKTKQYYGIRKEFVTPKATRGTWYSYDMQTNKFHKIVITKNTAEGAKLFKALNAKQTDKMVKKINKMSNKQKRAFYNGIYDQKLSQAEIYKYKGKTGFNVNNWLPTVGDGIYYVPVTRTRNGKKVTALRIGTGANNYFDSYAYKTKKLAK
ncbi:hypothetical protein [uncultured Lactobacillus sp.]|uniref:hypothetical protein n=1 Tax=uncultured Lactobacillus sp. TaxID=153152 RepID=UPI00280540FF|nr:hypothetical protein [uncultured Lactobacillus sp.]